MKKIIAAGMRRNKCFWPRQSILSSKTKTNPE
jgi:hypothetical protein